MTAHPKPSVTHNDEMAAARFISCTDPDFPALSLLFARHAQEARQSAEAASRAEVERLREALEAAADRIERAAYIMSDERLTALSEVFFRYADEARAALSASDGEDAA